MDVKTGEEVEVQFWIAGLVQNRKNDGRFLLQQKEDAVGKSLRKQRVVHPRPSSFALTSDQGSPALGSR